MKIWKNTTRQKYREQGLCIMCGKQPEPNKKKCSACLEQARHYKARLREAGFCITCNSRPFVPGTSKCKVCTEKSKAKWHRKRKKGLCGWCGEPSSEKSICDNCRDKVSGRKIELKQLVFAAYGGAKCGCCGCSIFEFLTIDHINNDGSKQRKELKKSGIGFYGWLRSKNYPQGYQVLCYNCNCAKKPGRDCPCKQKHTIGE